MPEGATVDFYGVLGVPRDATAREIRRAYRRLARRHHPDLNSSPDGPERFAALAHAYEILHDPAERARYDRTLDPTPPRRPSSASRPPTRSAPVAERIVQRGVLELSAEEALHLARHPLVLRDAHGQTIVLPAGTSHGAQITVLHRGRAALLTVRTPSRT